MSEKEKFYSELSRYKEALRVDASFDVVARVFMVSDKQAALFFIDGMIKDETMQKLMQELQFTFIIFFWHFGFSTKFFI